MFNNDEIKKHWIELKAQLLLRWDKLNEFDVDDSQGDPQKLRTLVQNQYGLAEPFETEFKKICATTFLQNKPTKKTDEKQPYKSSNMTDGWKAGEGMQTNSKNNSEKTADTNPGTDSNWGYNGVDTNSHQPEINSGGQVNSKDTDFTNKSEPIISDRTYSEAADEFSPNHFSHFSETIPLGGIDSSANYSSAKHAAFNSFEDHSRCTKKL